MDYLSYWFSDVMGNIANKLINKQLDKGDSDVVKAIFKIPGFDKDKFINPSAFRDKFTINNPKFIYILFNELYKVPNVINNNTNIKTDKFRFSNSTLKRSFNSTLFTNNKNKRITSGFSSAVLTQNRKSYGFIFRFEGNLIKDIYTIRYKYSKSGTQYYPYKLSCTSKINPALYNYSKG